jgi:SAM-dependent methyltransferase
MPPPDKTPYYAPDLAYIHDAGFSRFAESAAPLVLDALRQADIHDGLIVDLGCGGGVASRYFHNAGFRVVGVDLSEALIALARERVPGAEFHIRSFVDFEFPRCVAVSAIGEVLNYVADSRNGAAVRTSVLSRVYEALAPEGILLFDLAGPARAPASGQQRTFTQGPDWAALAESEFDSARNVLIRRITAFRQTGKLFRRSEETHMLDLVEPAQMLQLLKKLGFAAKPLDSYGALQLPQGLHAYLATKPAVKCSK